MRDSAFRGSPWLLLMVFLFSGGVAAEDENPPDPGGQPDSLYCPICGAQNQIGSKFCLKDGSPLPTIDPTRFEPGFVRAKETLSPNEIRQNITNASRSVVRVLVSTSVDLRYPVVSRPGALGYLEALEGESRVSGSGFVIDQEGHVLTNAHVASPFGTKADLSVETEQGDEFPAQLVGLDEASDLALLSIPPGILPPLPWGNSDEVRLGDETWAIGNPLDIGISLTRGTMSSLARMRAGENQIENFMHSDAFITHGNSGGPLVDVLGRTVGISDIGFHQAKGLGYSIPANMAQWVIKQLLTHGEYKRGWLGLYVHPVDAKTISKYRLKRPRGIVVESTIVGTPAAEAGFKPGDVIFGINDREAPSTYLLQEAISSVGPGATLKLTLDRGGETIHLLVTTALRPMAARIDPLLDLERYLGVRFERGSKKKQVRIRIVDRYGMAGKQGLRDEDEFTDVLPASKWPREQLRFPYNVRKLNLIPVGSLEEFRTGLEGAYLGGRVGVIFRLTRDRQRLVSVVFDENWPITI